MIDDLVGKYVVKKHVKFSVWLVLEVKNNYFKLAGKHTFHYEFKSIPSMTTRNEKRSRH
jgi:hypothetical protein